MVLTLELMNPSPVKSDCPVPPDAEGVRASLRETFAAFDVAQSVAVMHDEHHAAHPLCDPFDQLADLMCQLHPERPTPERAL